MTLSFDLHCLMGLVRVEGEWGEGKWVWREHPGPIEGEESKASPSIKLKSLYPQCKADLEIHLLPRDRAEELPVLNLVTEWERTERLSWGFLTPNQPSDFSPNSHGRRLWFCLHRVSELSCAEYRRLVKSKANKL